MTEQEKTLRQYLASVEVFGDITPHVTPEVVFVEYPNAINRRGQQRSLGEALAGMAAGRTMLAWQKYELNSLLECGPAIFTEIEWTGQMAIAAGSLKKDQVLRAHCAFRFEFAAGKIARQTSYDCYEPF